MIKLVVTDMDNTFLHTDKSVSRENLKAIEKLEDRGVAFTICTGRIQTMTETFVKELNLRHPYITVNGGVVWDPVKRVMPWGKEMDRTEAFALAGFLRDEGIDYGIFTMGKSYFPFRARAMKRFEFYNELSRQAGTKEIELEILDEDFKCLDGIPIYKMLVRDEALLKIDVAENYLKTLKNTDYTSSMKGLLDVIPKGVNKGMGLRMLAEKMGVKTDEICALGDYNNDIPMLKESGYPIAVENAADEVKSIAKYITASNNEDGFAKAVDHLIRRNYV